MAARVWPAGWLEVVRRLEGDADTGPALGLAGRRTGAAGFGNAFNVVVITPVGALSVDLAQGILCCLQ